METKLDRERIFTIRFTRDALVAKLRKLTAERDSLYEVLGDYEKTGDHNHGGRALRPYEDCPGGDCLVARARDLIEALDKVQV